MALGTLLLWFIGLGVLAVAGTVLVFLVKNKFINDVLLVLMMLCSLWIGFMASTAQPSNFVGARILPWGIALVAVAGVVLRFLVKKQLVVCKILVCASALVGLGFLFFG